MKLKVVAAFLAFAIASWAQSTNSSADQKSGKSNATCACCAKTDTANQDDPKQAKHACMKKSEDGKEAMACCSSDAKACADKCSKGGDAKAGACCKEMASSDGHAMDCCTSKDGAAHDCCGGNQCGKPDHEHHEHAAPGN